MDPSVIDFYFSLRSPYSWLAAQRVEVMLEGLPVELRWLHGYPRDLENHAMANTPSNKRLGYTVTDVSRFAERYGLIFKLPPRVDVDWAKVHAAFWYAHAQGVGPLFGKLATAARFGEGLDLEEDATLADLAERTGLDASSLIAAAEAREGDVAQVPPNDPEAAQNVFGVPTFVYKAQLFWGNDRIELCGLKRKNSCVCIR